MHETNIMNKAVSLSQSEFTYLEKALSHIGFNHFFTQTQVTCIVPSGT